MKSNYLLLLFGLMLLGACFVTAGEKKESWPVTGTSFDSLIKQAYDCHQQYLETEPPSGHGVNLLKGLYNTTLGKTEEEKTAVMAMTDSAFIGLISLEEVQQELKGKLSDDGKTTLDTLNIEMNQSLEEYNGILASANELIKEIPEAIKNVPDELKGLNLLKIPKVQGALETSKRWIEEVMDSAPIHIEQINTVISIIEKLTGE